VSSESTPLGRGTRSFKADGPSGIEDYGHRRFASRRKKGGWVELSAADIKAFRRRESMWLTGDEPPNALRGCGARQYEGRRVSVTRFISGTAS
jgi:hypothetical protein